MDWFQAVDIYCERTSAAFWAEPVNAASNLSFIAASLWAAATARARGLTSPVLWLLIAMAGLIGVGSFLFHTFATRWAELADTLPIWSFVAVFVLAAMHFIGGLPPRRVARIGGIIALAAAASIYFASNEGANPAPDPLNGSGQYAPALLALLVFSALTAWRRHPGAPWVIAATATFLLSLVFRTLDRDLCASIPFGTHFLWHLLNGAMVAFLLQMLVRTGQFTTMPRR